MTRKKNGPELFLSLLSAGALVAACSATSAELDTDGARSSGATTGSDGNVAASGGFIGGGASTGSAGSGNPGILLGSGTGGSSSAENDPDQSAAAGAAGAPSDQFEPVGTNPFVVVGHDPLSTFAVDVDTASYDYFRSQVRDWGRLPPKESVRLEEFVNSFDYTYDPPTEDAEHPFSLHLEAAPQLVTRDTTLLRVGIQGRIVPPSEKKPANLVFLVDVSGSMSQELPLVRTVLNETVDLLDPEDTVSIVTYASNPGTLLPATKIEEKETILAAVEKLISGGSTNGAGGIQAAYAEAEGAFIEGGINHVLLCTDGDFNVGVSSNGALEDLIIDKRASGVTLTVLGFGNGNVNDAMMERISNAGNGIYGYIGSATDAEDYAQTKMLQTLIHIAKDMKIQVEFNPEHVYAYRLLGYENRAIADVDFRNDIIDAGEIGSGHTVTALYELVLSPAAFPEREEAPSPQNGAEYDGEVEVGAGDLVLLKVRYKQPGAAESDPALEVSKSLAGTAVRDDLSGASEDYRWAVAVASFAEILKGSPYAQPEAMSVIEAVVESAKGEQTDRAEFAAVLGTTQSLLGSQP